MAIIREDDSNGECEVVVRVRDLLSRRITLEAFRGMVFMGGFSYADVLEWFCMGGVVGTRVVQFFCFLD